MAKLHHLSPVQKRQKRVRARVRGTAQRPRVSVFRSNKHMVAQAIDDDRGATITAVSSKVLRKQLKTKINKTEAASLVGKTLADQLKQKKVSAVVFDRGQFRYHGRVKAVADALRQEGLTL